MEKATAMKRKVAAEESAEVEEEESQPSIIDWKTLWKPMSLIVGLFNATFIGAETYDSLRLVCLLTARWTVRCALRMGSGNRVRTQQRSTNRRLLSTSARCPGET